MTVDTALRRRRFTLGTLCAGLLIIAIGNTLVNVVLSALARELGATNRKVQWIIDSYVDSMRSTMLVGAATALIGALVAMVLPSRASDPEFAPGSDGDADAPAGAAPRVETRPGRPVLQNLMRTATVAADHAALSRWR